MHRTALRLTGLQDTYEFKRDIIIGAENPRSGKIMAEKMIRWGRGEHVMTTGGRAGFQAVRSALRVGWPCVCGGEVVAGIKGACVCKLISGAGRVRERPRGSGKAAGVAVDGVPCALMAGRQAGRQAGR